MKLKKINYIKDYKSFIDFNWSEFCLDSAGNEKNFCPYNILFGENGSGKSSICEILKDISKNRPFCDTSDKPKSIQLTVDNNQHNYNAGTWDNYFPQNSILFFDQTFVDENVHTNGERSNERNKHSQNSGKLLIDLDAEANRIKQKESDTAKALKDFEDTNTIKLNQTFLPADLNIYVSLKDMNDEELIAFRELNSEKHKYLSDNLEQLKLIKKQSTSLAAFNPPESIKLSLELPPISEFEELFTRKIEGTTTKIASDILIKHINSHKDFIEKGLHIIESSPNKNICPFCMQSLESQEVVISTYSDFFNKTYQEQKSKFIADIESKIVNLNELKREANQLPAKVTSSYNALSVFWNNYNISSIYSDNLKDSESKQKDAFNDRFDLEEKIGSLSSYPKGIDELLNGLENLKKLASEPYDYKIEYNSVLSHLNNIKTILATVTQSLKKYADTTIEFKTKYSDVTTINQEIQEKEPILVRLSDYKNYFERNLHQQIKEWNKLKDEKEALRLTYTAAKDELKSYILLKAPTLILSKMMVLLNRFKLSFTLEPNRVTGSTSEVPFSFKIIDLNGKERNIKTGLSEGERQLISLAFFFSINENTAEKDNKILIFDDPITSLDASNLKILSDVIFEQVKIYSQVFVFTHHPLFYKYLIKKDNPNPNKYGILKNTVAFKGSFIYVDSEFDLLTLLKGTHQSLILKATSGTLSIEEAAITYGHILRLSVERFIKNELLLWNKEDNFSNLTGGLKDAKCKIKLLSDSDLDVIDKVYKYCNYANFLHADKEATSALNELLQHIDRYIIIIETARNPGLVKT